MFKPLLRLAPLLLLGACATQTDTRPRVAAATTSAGMVSSADPRASEAGREILRAGGSAADAAIAIALALTVVEPQSSGIGGGGFLVYQDARTGLASYDGRETAPAAAGPRLLLDAQGKPRAFVDASIGGQSVGVPGNIRMFAMAHERHGKLPWARLFAPAIRLAQGGFAITPRMNRMVEGRVAAARLTPWGRQHLFAADGTAKPVGTIVRNPELARLLEGVATRGPDWFYTGPPAGAIVRTVTTAARNPSSMTLGDLASYDARQREALCGYYRGFRICGMGPPSSGGTTVIAILAQLERFDLAALGPDNPAAWHLIGESMRLAYADREKYLGDPDFVQVPVAGLLDPQYLARRSRLISPSRAMATVTAGRPEDAPRVAAMADGEVPSTSHMVAADRFGNVATLTSTIEAPWGSGLTVDGYYLNNELTDFSFVPEQDGLPAANRVEGGKRPRSSMSPTIVYAPDGRVRLAVGAAGGATIIAQVAKAIIGVIDWKLSARDAIALPQIVVAGAGIGVERGTRLEPMIPTLTALGHAVRAVDSSYKANAVELIDGEWAGAADPRSEGVALRQ